MTIFICIPNFTKIFICISISLTQCINIKNEDVIIKKGEKIAQAFFQKFLITDDDSTDDSVLLSELAGALDSFVEVLPHAVAATTIVDASISARILFFIFLLLLDSVLYCRNTIHTYLYKGVTAFMQLPSLSI